MRVFFCGVRGSTPAPGADFLRYGGHTSCLALAPGPERGGDFIPTLVLDAGTGLRRVTALLGARPFIGTILLTHLHWDHFQGLPFFRGGDREEAEVCLLLPDPGDCSAEEVLARGMSPPQFPITPRELRGSWSFSSLAPGRFGVGANGYAPLAAALAGAGGFTVEAREIPHKGGRTFGYRVSDGTATIAYLPDHCPTVLGPGPDGLGEYHRAALALADRADVLVHDAFLLREELAREAYFGHAAADYAVRLGECAGVRRVVLFHHRPERTDAALDALAMRFADAPVEVSVAFDEMVLDL